MKLQKTWFIIIGLIFLMLFNSCCLAITNTNIQDKKLVVIFVDSFAIEDMLYPKTPKLKQVVENSYLGLMNTRTEGRSTRVENYVTFGAGNRASSYTTSANGFNVWEKINQQRAGNIFTVRVGERAGIHEVVNPYKPLLDNLNASSSFKAVPGTLGDLLKKNNVKTAVIGNGDLFDEKHREVVSVFMDFKGRVERGLVDQSLLLKDSNFPTGYRQNYDKILQYTKKWLKNCNIIGLQLTDLYRLEKSREYLTTPQYNKFKDTSLKRMDVFLEAIIKILKNYDYTLMLLSPFPAAQDYETGEKLSPVLIYKGDGKHGILTSSTTKREGLITNTDFLPWVLNIFSIQSSFPGNIITKEKLSHIKFINNLSEKTAKLHSYRSPAIKSYIFMQIILVFLIIIGLLFKTLPLKLALFLKNLSLLIMCVPLAALLLPLVGYYNLYFTLVILFGISLAIFILMISCNEKLIKDIYKTIALLSGITVVVLVLDLLSGGFLIKNSLLGYCPIIGARYYGIGNEYSGILIGATIVGASILTHHLRINAWLEKTIMILVAAVIAIPWLGANFGGAVTAVAAFSYLSLKSSRKNIKVKDLINICINVIVLLSIIGFVDYYFLKGYSHLGKIIKSIINGNFKALSSLIIRKISINIKLLNWTIWSQVLLSFFVFMTFTAYRPIGVLNRIFKDSDFIKIAFVSVVIADIVGMIVNDSGVVISATTSIFMVMTLSISILEKEFLRCTDHEDNGIGCR